MKPEHTGKKGIETEEQIQEPAGSLLCQALVMSGWLNPEDAPSNDARDAEAPHGDAPVFNDPPQ